MTSKICKLILEKSNNFGFINAKNVNVHKKIQNKENATIDLKFFNLFNI